MNSEKETQEPAQETTPFDPLVNMMDQGKMDEFKEFLQKNPEILTKRTEHDATLLHFVSLQPSREFCAGEPLHAEFVKELLNQKADSNAVDAYGNTPLMWVCMEPVHHCVLELLIKHPDTRVTIENKNKNMAEHMMVHCHKHLNAITKEELKQKDYYEEGLTLLALRRAQDRKDEEKVRRYSATLAAIRLRLELPYKDLSPEKQTELEFVEFLQANPALIVSVIGDRPSARPIRLRDPRSLRKETPKAFDTVPDNEPKMSAPIVDESKTKTITSSKTPANKTEIKNNKNHIRDLCVEIKGICKTFRAKGKTSKNRLQEILSKVHYLENLYLDSKRKQHWEFSNHQQELKKFLGELIKLKNTINEKKKNPEKAESSTHKIVVLIQEQTMKTAPKTLSEKEQKAIQAKEEKALKRRAMHFRQLDPSKQVLKELVETVRKKEESKSLIHPHQYSVMWRLRNPMSLQGPGQERGFAASEDPVLVRR